MYDYSDNNELSLDGGLESREIARKVLNLRSVGTEAVSLI